MARPYEPLNQPIGPISPDSLKAGVAAGVANRLIALWRNWRNRRALRQLYEMDSRQLADIGLDRSDVTAALMTPISQSPSMVLTIRMVGRRAAARAFQREAAERRRSRVS